MDKRRRRVTIMMTTAPFVSRTESAQSRLYEFAKTALIKIFATPYAAGCHFYCGGGVDTDKWSDALIDASSTVITEDRELWESQTKPYTAEFFELDPCTGNLEAYFKTKAFQLILYAVCSTCRAKYQKMVVTLHNKGAGVKLNPAANCIRSKNYIITFEVEEEK